MKDFTTMFIIMFLVNFLPLVYGWGLKPENPWWVVFGYSVIAGLYAIGSAASKIKQQDKEKLLGEKND